jgi:hypothetical protein
LGSPPFWGRNRGNGNQGPSRRGDTQEISGAYDTARSWGSVAPTKRGVGRRGGACKRVANFRFALAGFVQVCDACGHHPRSAGASRARCAVGILGAQRRQPTQLRPGDGAGYPWPATRTAPAEAVTVVAAWLLLLPRPGDCHVNNLLGKMGCRPR